jgi:hypothetical protein
VQAKKKALYAMIIRQPSFLPDYLKKYQSVSHMPLSPPEHLA